MDRRDFIKNSILLCGCSYLAYQGKFLYERNTKGFVNDGIPLKKSYLVEEYHDKRELPKKIRIDLCSLCQLNCVRCWMRLFPKSNKRNGGLGYLTFKNFKTLVDDNNIEEIEVVNQGEIFLNPELLDIIKYAYNQNIILTANTGVNLNYLTDEMAEALIKYQFKSLTVSIDGATPKTYAIYRRGGDLNTVINHIKKINYFKKKYNSQYPELTYKFIVFGHNEHEIDKAKRLAKKLNMRMLFDKNCDPTYSPIKNAELVKKKTGLDTNVLHMLSDIEAYKKDNSRWITCNQMWKEPQINWNGKVLGCCCNAFNNFGGNVFEDGLLKALNHPKMIYAKNMLAHNAKPLPEIYCTNCDTFQALKKMNMSIKPPKEASTPIFYGLIT